MSLIPYPNIPNVLGAPVIQRVIGSSSFINQTIANARLLNAALITFFNDNVNEWLILDKDNKQAIAPDSILSVDARTDSKIATHPVEMGSFAAYNKTQMPNEVRVVMTCNGDGASSRDAFIITLEAMKQSINLYSITTPDNAYSNMNLVHYDIRRESTKGAMMIIVECIFIEVRETATATYTVTQQPSGSGIKNNGQLKSQVPIPAQTNPNLIGVIQ